MPAVTLPDGIYFNQYSGESYGIWHGTAYGNPYSPYPYYISAARDLKYPATLISAQCPLCPETLEWRGEFDGRIASSGVTRGHRGFGYTAICDAGHWFAIIQGALIPPERILTIVD